MYGIAHVVRRSLHLWCAARSTCPDHCTVCVRPLLISARGGRAGVFRGAGRLRGGRMAASSSDALLTPASQRQRAGPPWVQQLKKRMPRHQEEDLEEDWFLAKTIPSGERWFQAEQFMLKERREGGMLKMSQAFDMIRRDLATTRAAWYPQKWTTMVEGRPVQVHPGILPYSPLAEPDARPAKCHGHGDLHKRIFKKNVFSQKPACPKQGPPFMSCSRHEK